MRDSAIKNVNGINNDKFPPYRNNSFILFKIIESLGAPFYFLNILKYIIFYLIFYFSDHLLVHLLWFIQFYLICCYLFPIFLWSKG